MVSLKIRPGKKAIVAKKREETKKPEVDFSKPWAIWLDDERPIPQSSGFQYICAKNPKEFIDLIDNHGVPSFISFDWYLGSGWDNGEAVISWLIEADKNGELSFPEDFLFDVHSSDNAKNKVMRTLLRDYLMSKGKMQFFPGDSNFRRRSS